MSRQLRVLSVTSPAVSCAPLLRKILDQASDLSYICTVHFALLFHPPPPPPTKMASETVKRSIPGKTKYNQLSPNGHRYKMDTSIRWTADVGPCHFSVIFLQLSSLDGYFSKIDSRGWIRQCPWRLIES